MACGLAVADAIQLVTGLHVGLKWPNDVVGATPDEKGRERKIAGVLCESKTDEGGKPFLVLGIGVNVNGPYKADYYRY